MKEEIISVGQEKSERKMNKLKKTLEDLLGPNSLIGRSTYNRPPKNAMNGNVSYTKDGFAYDFGFGVLQGGFSYDLRYNEIYLVFNLPSKKKFCILDNGNNGVVDRVHIDNESILERKKLTEEDGNFMDYDFKLAEYKVMTDFNKIYDYWEKNYKEK